MVSRRGSARPDVLAQVRICGGLPELRSMAIRLMEQLDVEVETLDSLFRHRPGSSASAAARIQGARDRYAPRVGSRCRLARPVNLLRERTRRVTKTMLSRAAVAAGVATGVGVAWQVQQSHWWRSPPVSQPVPVRPASRAPAGPPVAAPGPAHTPPALPRRVPARSPACTVSRARAAISAAAASRGANPGARLRAGRRVGGGASAICPAAGDCGSAVAPLPPPAPAVARSAVVQPPSVARLPAVAPPGTASRVAPPPVVPPVARLPVAPPIQPKTVERSPVASAVPPPPVRRAVQPSAGESGETVSPPQAEREALRYRMPASEIALPFDAGPRDDPVTRLNASSRLSMAASCRPATTSTAREWSKSRQRPCCCAMPGAGFDGWGSAARHADGRRFARAGNLTAAPAVSVILNAWHLSKPSISGKPT